jgi:hypothetical protein
MISSLDRLGKTLMYTSMELKTATGETFAKGRHSKFMAKVRAKQGVQWSLTKLGLERP